MLKNLFLKKSMAVLAMLLFCGALSFASMSTVIAGTACEGDFDNDGDVDGSDLSVFAADFGRTDCDLGPPNELWVQRYNGPRNTEDRAYALALDAAGNVYVTGWSRGNETYWDYATIKYGYED